MILKSERYALRRQQIPACWSQINKATCAHQQREDPAMLLGSRITLTYSTKLWPVTQNLVRCHNWSGRTSFSCHKWSTLAKTGPGIHSTEGRKFSTPTVLLPPFMAVWLQVPGQHLYSIFYMPFRRLALLHIAASAPVYTRGNSKVWLLKSS